MNAHVKAAAVLLALAIAFGGWYFYQKDNAAPDTVSEGYSTSTEAIINGVGTPSRDGNDVINNKTTTVIVTTNKGTIELELWGSDAPNTVANFEKLVKSGFYDGTKFHRVIKGFMIQGGDPLSKDDAMRVRWGTGGPGYSFADEFNSRKIVRGVLAMANAGPNTNGSQFFIVTAAETPWLDGKHTAFGRVVKGMEVVDAIEASAVNSADQPLQNVVIEKASVK